VVRIQGAELTAKKRAAEKAVADREASKKAADEAAAMARAVWTHDELSMMAKATVKYPVGTQRRWELITEMVNSVGKRSMKEVIAKSKEAASAPGAEKMGEAQAFELYLKKVEKAKTKAEVEQIASDQLKRSTASLVVTNAADAAAKGLIKTETKQPAAPVVVVAPTPSPEPEVKVESTGPKKLSKAEQNALKAAQAEAAERAAEEKKKAQKAAKKAPKTSPTNATATAAATTATATPNGTAAPVAAATPAAATATPAANGKAAAPKGKAEAKNAATATPTPTPAVNGKPAPSAVTPTTVVPAKTATAAVTTQAKAVAPKVEAKVPTVVTPPPAKWAALTKAMPATTAVPAKAEASKAAAPVANGRAPVAVSTIPAKKKTDEDDGWKGAWTSDQQLALEGALRTVPKEVADRWAAIAALVPGKTKKECVERFKHIRTQILATK
jgi:hypothetical protein